jgi:tetratricopeptide (TPR) repeat protein
MASSDSRWKFQGLSNQALEQMYRGRSAEALRLLDAAATSIGPRGSPFSAGARLGIANILMDRGQPATALVSAKRAYADASGVGGITYFSLAVIRRLQDRLGQQAELEKTEAEIAARRKSLPSERLQRLTQHMEDATRAIDRRDTAAAIRLLKEGEGLARPGDSNSQLFFELGSTLYGTGQYPEAATYFDRIVRSGLLRAGDAIPYVRSLYFLGQISERNGDRAKAAEYYRRFLQYWGEGDMDRERVADAKKKAG